MRPLAIANIEFVEATPFVVANLYGKEGFLIDQIVVPYESLDQAIDRIYKLAKEHNANPLEVWTSNHEIYAEMLNVPGVAGQIKHESDTDETAKAVEAIHDILIDLYNVPPIKPKPKLPKWRKWAFLLFQKITNKLEGDGKYDTN